MKKILRKIKSLFRRRAGKYEVWDTSALSNYFERFKKTLQQDENVTLVIPEGVSHEISNGRRNNEHCKDIYRFIEGNMRSPNLIISVTPDYIRSWAVDEQVIYTAKQYYDKGYTTTLITCDRDQSFRAKLKHLNVECLQAVKCKPDTVQPSIDKQENIPVVVPVNLFTKETQEEVKPEQSAQSNEEVDLPAKTVGKQCWLAFDKNIAVYDVKGKRKIASRKDGIQVTRDDKVYYKDVAYVIKNIGINAVTIRMCSA